MQKNDNTIAYISIYFIECFKQDCYIFIENLTHFDYLFLEK